MKNGHRFHSLRTPIVVSAVRFSDFRGIAARFASVGTCGHEIEKGDSIGYAPRSQQTSCADCWRSWSYENAEADLCEQNFSGYGY